MKICDYVKEKAIFLIFNLTIYCTMAIILYMLNVKLPLIIIGFFIWFIPLLVLILIDGFKYKRYFNKIIKVMDSLDKKYLLPEIIEEADFFEGRLVNEILKEISRDMHENVKSYKDKEISYREYIESWVHEIKTPIASCRLITENDKNKITSEIDSQLDKIDNYIEQVLYYSRSRDVSKDYIIKELDLLRIVNNVVKRNCRDFILKHIKAEIDLTEEFVFSDSKWLEFIVNQIVLNAIKYSKKQEAYVRFSVEKRDNSTILIIEDNGIGINEKDIGRVFEKGFTGENGRVYGKSTGVGLYLCKNLCEKLNIDIVIKSEVRVGTKVYLFIPIDRVRKENCL
ncbi:MAG: sensor histidine kinase [Clostridiaceae bacterium]|nr:sensor histidine kinase [Clostridiaceae bacterium]